LEKANPDPKAAAKQQTTVALEELNTEIVNPTLNTVPTVDSTKSANNTKDLIN